MVKPFLKWAGGKSRLVSTIEPHLHGKRLLEPFAGSCALFLGSQFPQAVLADVNGDLIALYQHLQGPQGGAFIDATAAYFTPAHNTQDVYTTLRDRFNALSVGTQERASLFVYLNRHAFNGLCRYNAKGGFNVPYGRYAKDPSFPREAMNMFRARTQSCTFVQQGFDATFAQAQAGDAVYADPPYVPLSDTAYFSNYATGGFGWDAHQRLAQAAADARDRGALVAISNHVTPAIVDLYESLGGDCSVQFGVQRTVSARSSSRTKAPEMLAIFRP